MTKGNLTPGKDKIQKICDSIRKETLEPVRQEAREIIEHAHLQAADIVKQAKLDAEHSRKKALQEIEEKQKTFQSSLQLSCRQGIESLKQKIERELFNPELADLIARETKHPTVIVQIVESFMRSLEEKGIEEDFEVMIPKEVSPRQINALLAQKILDRLKNQSVEMGDFHGGVQIRMKDRQITIDISDTAIRELLAAYIRRDFRDLIFQV
jgi:V/A-type H+/Na+-transporting ATPase subunit E